MNNAQSLSHKIAQILGEHYGMVSSGALEELEELISATLQCEHHNVED